MLRVTSSANPRLKEAGRLIASTRDRRKAGKCVLEGEHIVAVYGERVGRVPLLIATEEACARPAAASLCAQAESVLVVSAALFAEVTALPVAMGMIGIVPTPIHEPRPAATFSLLVDDVQDPGNVGSMLRTAAAAGVEQVLLSKHCAFAWSPKVLRAAQGAHFQLAIAEDIDLAPWAARERTRGVRVVALVARDGGPIFELDLRGPVALAVGNEGGGLSAAVRAVATHAATIPMPGGSESLNAAAAVAVCLFEVVRQRGVRVTSTPR